MPSLADILEVIRQFFAPIPGFQTLASAPYFFRPFVMIVVLGLVCGLVGVLVNLRCAEFQCEAMVHTVFPGIVGGALFYGIEHIIPAASIAALLAALALTWVSHTSHGAAVEAGTAVVLTSFFSVGIVISLAKGDMSGQLEALMFGRLLEVTDDRLAQALLVCLIALVAILATWKEQVMYAFDPVGAYASGLPRLRLNLILNVAVAAVVVAASTAVGTLLVIGYLVVPGAAARLLANKVKTMVAISVLCGIGGGYLGMMAMFIPAPHPISPQASVALAVVATYFIALIIYSAKRVVRA